MYIQILHDIMDAPLSYNFKYLLYYIILCFILKKYTVLSSNPLGIGSSSESLKPKATDSTKPYIYYVLFTHTYDEV